MKDTHRKSLKIISGIGATRAFPFLADELFGRQEPVHDPDLHLDDGHESHYGVPAVPAFTPQFFTAAEGLVIVRMADLSIPQTDTPGAAAAGVPQYIDQVVLQNAEHQKLVRDRVVWMNSHGKPFIEMPKSEQIAMLTALCDAAETNGDASGVDQSGVLFFGSMKKLTADGYYTSYAGLVQELGYRGNAVLASFEGCVHER